MKNEFCYSRRLQKFLYELSNNDVKMVVLRAYERLPYYYSHDLDVLIQYEQIPLFFSSFKKTFPDDSLKITDSRRGLIKVHLEFGDEILEFDIVYGFFIAGIAYYDALDVVDSAIFDSSKLVYIPIKDHEVDIAILKELLHNGRMRYDKSEYLTYNLTVPNYNSRVFDSPEIENILENVVNKNYSLQKLRVEILVRLIVADIMKRGVISVVLSVINHLFIKYVSNGRLHDVVRGGTTCV